MDRRGLHHPNEKVASRQAGSLLFQSPSLLRFGQKYGHGIPRLEEATMAGKLGADILSMLSYTI